MANRTVKDAHSVKGTNPQYLVEKILRSRIYECRYWKEECFALTAELMVDKAMQLKFVGGVYGGNIIPTPFICLVLKMLQIQPEKDIIVEFIRNEDFKYVRALGAIYMRLVGTSLDCFKYLEPLYNDYRKIKRQSRDGNFEVMHMDEFIDDLIRQDRVCDIILPRIQKRSVHEDLNQLEPRVSALDDDMEDLEPSDEEEDEEVTPGILPHKHRYKDLDKPHRSPSPRYRRSRSKSPQRRERPRSPNKRRSRSRSRERRHRDTGHRHKENEDRHKRSRKGHRDHKERTNRDDERHRHRDHHRNQDRSRGNRPSKTDLDIQEANELRAKLGMAPLRP